MKAKELATVRDVLHALLTHPYELLVVRWNWKSAILSSIMRALLFFVANISAGKQAAWAAMYTEFIYRALTSGFYASLTQSFRHARPVWQATLTAMVLLPLVSHSIELCIHWLRGTPKLALSILASAGFTTISTAYNLFAMRHGALVVGQEGRPLREDLRRTPAILLRFMTMTIKLLVLQIPTKLWQLKRHRFSSKQTSRIEIAGSKS
ncbi:MAG: hypothetical protein JNM09_02815 [Blastocatellia bacterium]|nr:hypothetical protein [Blastocatellia bacterium]